MHPAKISSPFPTTRAHHSSTVEGVLALLLYKLTVQSASAKQPHITPTHPPSIDRPLSYLSHCARQGEAKKRVFSSAWTEEPRGTSPARLFSFPTLSLAQLGIKPVMATLGVKRSIFNSRRHHFCSQHRMVNKGHGESTSSIYLRHVVVRVIRNGSGCPNEEI